MPLERHFAHFIQEQRARVGLLEPARVVGVGARKRAFAMAEQLAFHQVPRNRRAVDRQHRPVRALAVAMDRAGHQFLARPALAPNQHAAAGAGDAADLALERLHGGAFSQQFVEVRTLGHQSPVVGLQRGLLTGADQRHDENVRQGNGDLVVADTKTSLLPVKVDRAERVLVVNERHAQRVSIVL